MPPREHLKRDQWEALIERVFRRDLRQAWLRVERLRLKMPLSQVPAKEACVARFLDPDSSGTCYGRLTFDHVHDRGKTAMGMKADDDEEHLVTVCEWHHGTNRTGGGWATSKRAREIVRQYLAEQRG
jgi:hypothetical protein